MPTASTSSGRFDWTMATLSAVFVGGVYLDGWAHTHGQVDQSFFTPWHAVFYAGYVVTAAALVVAWLRGRARGLSSRRAVPGGYELSFVGALVFAVGGLTDLLWHTLYGIEVGVEALLSPTHLILALGLGLIATGSVRAAWRRPGIAVRGEAEGEPSGYMKQGWGTQGPVVLGLLSTFSVLTFFTQYAHPLVFVAAGRGHPFGGAVGLGVASILLQAVILMGAVLLAARRRLPRGGLALVLALNGVAMGFLDFSGGYPLALVVAAVVTAVLVDILYAALRPGAARPGAYRVFAFAAPALVYVGYFVALMTTEGISWSVHLWTGSIVLAGLTGWLLSYLLMPPRLPEEVR